MKTESAFWDTSGIMPLWCAHATSAAARRTAREYKKVAIWWGTEIEVRSGFARLKRENAITARDFSSGIKRWVTFRTNARIMDPTSRVLSIAVELPEKYGLRALDSFQLAAALRWCNERPRNRPFITADNRLGEAARDAGFDVVEIG